MLFGQLLRAFLVGVCASIPIGPIAILVVRNSLGKGRGSGLVTALGACFVDTIFSAIAIFALAYVQKFMDDAEVLVLLVGGLIVAALGAVMAFRNPFHHLKRDRRNPRPEAKEFFKACALGFSNPGAILVMFALMAFFGLGNIPAGDWRIGPIIVMICLGSASYWLVLTLVLSRFSDRISLSKLVWVNRIAGYLILMFGLIMMFQGLFDVLLKGAPLINV